MAETIAAIATALSASGIGIIRISGPESRAIAGRIYRSKGGKKDIRKVPSHTINYGFIQDGEETIDEVLVMVMDGPRSYTGEDTVEIDCHGGVLAMRKILDTVIKYGARPAQPGEFTKRAFLNGRIDLSQAEAVIDVINAKNEYALKSSVSQLKGNIQKAIREIREAIIYQIAYIESALDDPEHISIDGYGETLYKEVKKQEEKIDRLLLSQCRKIFSFKYSFGGRKSHCYRYSGNHQRYPGRDYSSPRDFPADHRYCWDPGYRRCGGKDWRGKGDRFCKRRGSGAFCSGFFDSSG